MHFIALDIMIISGKKYVFQIGLYGIFGQKSLQKFFKTTYLLSTRQGLSIGELIVISGKKIFSSF
jgi:hypothetical protein